mmetsp:Transcript_105624/g.169930  ORF Transcript_105624/g.169930 Transcript_105624/m.169930 type:complete len:100 (-) Transcript_105624:25-324(-)
MTSFSTYFAQYFVSRDPVPLPKATLPRGPFVRAISLDTAMKTERLPTSRGNETPKALAGRERLRTSSSHRQLCLKGRGRDEQVEEKGRRRSNIFKLYLY